MLVGCWKTYVTYLGTSAFVLEPMTVDATITFRYFLESKLLRITSYNFVEHLLINVIMHMLFSFTTFPNYIIN